LLDHQQRHALAPYLPKQFVNLVDDRRRKAERRLVEHQQARPGQHRPGDRQHLLLASGKLARRLVAPLAENREVGEDLVDV
jgi:hypothetical protein